MDGSEIIDAEFEVIEPAEPTHYTDGLMRPVTLWSVTAAAIFALTALAVRFFA